MNGLEEVWRECIDEGAEHLEGLCKIAGDERAIVDVSLMMGNLSFVSKSASAHTIVAQPSFRIFKPLPPWEVHSIWSKQMIKKSKLCS